MLDSFLDYVARQHGQLVIIGDLFELLRYPMERIIQHRRALLDRLAAMETIYIRGNHDEAVAPFLDGERTLHEFFDRTRCAFTHRVGPRRIKFMHVHEVEPLINANVQSLGRAIGAVACLFEFRQGTCCLSNKQMTHLLLEMGEQVLQVWDWVTKGLDRAVRDCSGLMPDEQIRGLGRRIRTQRMLTRYYTDREQGLYDIAIVGHTHKAGVFGGWYFNCGSWTGKSNNFLRISPAGEVAVFDWTGQGPRPNRTVVTH